MNKIKLVLVLFLPLSLSVLAQENSLKKNTVSLGGSLGFSILNGGVENGPKYRYTSELHGYGVKLIPMFNYFLSDRFSIGLGIGVDYSEKSMSWRYPNTTNTNKFRTESLFFPVIPSVTWFKPLTADGRFGLYLSGNGTYSYGYITEKTYAAVSNPGYYRKMATMVFGAQLSPGLFYFPMKKIAVQASLGNLASFTGLYYINESFDGEYESTSAEFTFLDFSAVNLVFSGSYFF
jgi:hypothetical protein